MAEFLLIYTGMKPDEFLKMPAMRMFAMLKAGRKIRSQDRNAFFYELCDIAFIPSQKLTYQQKLKGYYRRKWGPMSARPGMDLADPNFQSQLAGMLGG